jgi:hypothetical protein
METTQRVDIRPADHDERLKAARERARWEIGDPSWADTLIAAYLHPDEDREALRQEEEA